MKLVKRDDIEGRIAIKGRQISNLEFAMQRLRPWSRAWMRSKQAVGRLEAEVAMLRTMLAALPPSED